MVGRAVVEVKDGQGHAISSPVAETIRSEAESWLRENGYTLDERVTRKTRVLVVLSPHYAERVADVPSRALLLPGAYGYMGVYSGGGKVTVADRSVALGAWLYRAHQPPVMLTSGTAVAGNDASFFESESRMRMVVSELLERSRLAAEREYWSRKPKISVMAPNLEDGDPACWYRLGFDYLQGEATGSKEISRFTRGSRAEGAGMRVGDLVTHMDGLEVTAPAEFTEGQIVDVRFLRNLEVMHARVPAVLICVDD